MNNYTLWHNCRCFVCSVIIFYEVRRAAPLCIFDYSVITLGRTQLVERGTFLSFQLLFYFHTFFSCNCTQFKVFLYRHTYPYIHFMGHVGREALEIVTIYTRIPLDKIYDLRLFF